VFRSGLVTAKVVLVPLVVVVVVIVGIVVFLLMVNYQHQTKPNEDC
jgi:hypothetical protein